MPVFGVAIPTLKGMTNVLDYIGTVAGMYVVGMYSSQGAVTAGESRTFGMFAAETGCRIDTLVVIRLPWRLHNCPNRSRVRCQQWLHISLQYYLSIYK